MAQSKTMKAWRFHEASGGVEKHMRLEDIPMPLHSETLVPDSTLIKVLTVCLNPVDIKFAETPYIGHQMHPMPAIPGLDGVGRVIDTADRSLRVGQLVMFRITEKQSKGALAEYVVVPREGCAALPEGVSAAQGATVGTCGVTAVQAIVPYVEAAIAAGHPQPRVFINGGSGGTGTFQIQVAKAMGCHVVTSCSTPNVELCKSLGADVVVDYNVNPAQRALSEMVQKDEAQMFDLLVDNVDLPWKLYKAAHQYLKPTGTYVQIGGDITWQSIKELAMIKLLPVALGGGRRRWTFLAMHTSREDAETVLAWMAQGKITIPIEDVIAFHDAPAAYRRLKEGRTRGKILVQLPTTFTDGDK